MLALPSENEFIRLDIRIHNGKIAEFGNLDNSPNEEIINIPNRLILPGGIDAHVHFDDPGFTSREDFYTGTSAAAQGGITSIIDMPCTSIPPITNIKNLKNKLSVIQAKAIVDYCLFGGISSQSLNENTEDDFIALADYVVGFKTYAISGMKTFSALDSYEFSKACKIAKKANIPILLHAEDADYINHTTNLEKNIGNMPINYYKSRPEISEIIAVSKSIEIAKYFETSLHIVHVSTADSVRLINHANQNSNLQITCETAPHYLEFNTDDFVRIGSALKVTPPVKSAINNRGELWKTLANGQIDFIASDHAPSTEAEKNTKSIWTDYGGISGTGTILPYIYSEGFVKGRISLQRLLQIMSYNPAKRYGIDKDKGSIEIGKDADFAIINPNAKYTVRGENFLSKGKITPFEGITFDGKIEQTILRGEIIYDCTRGIMVENGYGKFITNK